MEISQIKLNNYDGLWCVEPTRFSQACAMINAMNLTAHVNAQEPKRAVSGIGRKFDTVSGSIAVIDIQGTLTKAGSSLGGGGTIEMRQAIRQANEDKSISGIVLLIDSPGGTVSGTSDLANEVTNSAKPVVAYVEDLCCSAAMWVASQCDEIYANNATALVGSIGTFMGLYDVSKAFENEGIKPILVKSGEFKGGGFPGSKITDGQIAEWQKVIDATQSQFTSAIAKGRGMSLQAASKLATGSCFMAEEATRLRLIDGIKSFNDVVAGMRGRTSRTARAPMSDNRSAKEQRNAAIASRAAGANVGRTVLKFGSKTQVFSHLSKVENMAIRNNRLTASKDTPARDEYRQKIREKQQEAESRGRPMNHTTAAMAVNKENPGLCDRIVAEANP